MGDMIKDHQRTSKSWAALKTKIYIYIYIYLHTSGTTWHPIRRSQCSGLVLLHTKQCATHHANLHVVVPLKDPQHPSPARMKRKNGNIKSALGKDGWRSSVRKMSQLSASLWHVIRVTAWDYGKQNLWLSIHHLSSAFLLKLSEVSDLLPSETHGYVH